MAKQAGYGKKVPPGIHIHALRVGDYQVRLADTCDRQNPSPTLMIFNGLGVNLEILFPLMQSLGAVDCVTFDIPGVGGSEEPVFPVQVFGLTGLARDIADYYRLQTLAVMGISWGCCLATEFAWRYPGRCTQLILASGSAGVFAIPRSLGSLLELANPRRYMDKDYLRRRAPALYGGRFLTDPALIEEYLALLSEHRSPMTYYRQLCSIGGWTSVPWLSRISQPTLILAGRDDRMLSPLNARLLHEWITHSQVELLDDGHLFFFSSPAETAALITEFLCRDNISLPG